jgi:hypothetical protein
MAARRSGTADQRAQFHQGLVDLPARAGARGAGLGGAFHEGLGDFPKPGIEWLGAGIAGEGEDPGQDAHHISVKDRSGLIEGDAADGAGGVTSNARKLENLGVILWEYSLEPILDEARGGLEVPDAAVIAQAGPELEQEGEGCLRQVGDGGQASDPAFVIGNGGIDLGLLEHDFRDPNGVGITGAAPGQGAGMAGKPSQQTFHQQRG